LKLGDLAQALSLKLVGDASHEVTRLAPVASAGADELTFVVSAKYSQALEASSAGAVIVPESMADIATGNYLISKNPYASYAQASWLLTPESIPAAGAHPSAQVAQSASIHPSARIGAFSFVGENAQVGADAVIGEHSVLSSGVRIGARTRLFPRVCVYHDCEADGWQAIHQTGRVIIGNKVHIGANTTVDRGAIDDTILCDGVILDNQIQIAHNVYIGENTAVAACAGVAGSAHIGANCQIGGACNIVGHLSIADGTVLNATSYVTQAIDTPGRYSSGMPLQPAGEWKRTYVLLPRLNELAKRVKRLERKVDE